MTIRLYRTAERPSLEFWLRDNNDNLIDLSSGYTFSFKIGAAGAAATFTKTTGITGAAGAGSEPDGTPNLTIAFTAAELDDVTAGAYLYQIVATTSSLDRVFQGSCTVADVIT